MKYLHSKFHTPSSNDPLGFTIKMKAKYRCNVTIILADLSHAPSAEVKNAWSCTSTSPYIFMALCLVK
jgi:hypothetical protein